MQAIRISAVAAHLFDVLSRAGPHNDRQSLFERARELVRWQLRVIRRRRRIAATRAALEVLDDRTLEDIGLHRSELRAVATGTYGGIREQQSSPAGLRRAA